MNRPGQNLLLLPLLLLWPTTLPAQDEKPPPPTLEQLAEIVGQRARRNQEKTRRELKRHLQDLHLEWSANRDYLEKVILLLSRQGPDAAPLFVPYLDPGGNSPKDRNLSHNVRRILERTGIGNQVAELVRTARTGSPLGRENAVLLLGRSGEPQAAAVIRERLADKAVNVAATACRTLADMGAVQARGEILGLLDRDDPTLTMAVLRALLEFGRQEDLARVTPVVLRGGREETLLLLFELMKKVGRGREKTVRVLLDILEKKQREWSLTIQLAATRTLAQVAPEEDREAVTLLKRLLRDPKTWDQLRQEVAFALNRLGDKSGHNLLLADANRFLRRNSKVPYAYIRRGDIYFKLGLYAKAAGDYRRAISLCKGTGGIVPTTWIDLFRSLARVGQTSRLAREIKRSGLPLERLRQAVARHPELARACREDERVRRLLLGDPDREEGDPKEKGD